MSGDGGLDAQVQVYVQTRGSARATDYAFLGGAPAQPWWRAYRDATAFDHPTVLVTSDGRCWAAYLSGIPSARVDAVGTVVRYTLVLDGPCGAPDTACVPAAVAAWLDDVAGGGGPGQLSAALDARFPPDDVQRWLAAAAPAARPEPEAPVAAEVRRRTLAALASVPATPVDEAAGPDGDWIGAIGAPGPRTAFTARTAALVGGDVGRALLLNLVGAPDDVAPLRDPASPLAVLVETTDPRLARPVALAPVVEAKKAPAPPARDTGRPGATTTATPPRAAPALLVALAVLALLAALVVTTLVLLR